MNRSPRTLLIAALGLLVAAVLQPAHAQEMSPEAMKARIERLEREVGELRALLEKSLAQSPSRAEVEELGQQVAQTRQEVADTRGQQDEWKNYDSTVHLAGYGHAMYTDQDSEDGRFGDILFAPIFHYQWKDFVLFEAELEVELDGAETSVNLEYVTVDLLLHDYLIVLGGRFLSPIGQFRQNLHPSWVNRMPSAPVGFGHDGAAPTSEVGFQARGGFPLPFGDGVYANYAVYAGNGPSLELNEDGDEIEAVMAEGSVEDTDGNKVFGGRIGLVPFANAEIGFSTAMGDVALPGEADRDYDVYDVDWKAQWRNFNLIGEWVRTKVGSLATSVAPEEQEWDALYTQLSYRFLPTKLEAVVRYGDFDSNHAHQVQEQWALGANWWFNSHTVAKIAYEFNDGVPGEAADDDRLLLQLGYGF
ncbi:MAG: hypothetical protein IT495_21540 [Gammaproteobacteria bacterium]|nr:hypothetical protein [Gammaproteobacteria bacterium]